MLRDAWRLSLGTLTAIPVAPPDAVDQRRAGTAMLLAPVASVPLGLALALVAVVGHELGLPALVTALLAVGIAIMGTRGLHLDGLSDVADGLAASHDAERSLAVMKSGKAGPAGVVATVLVLGLQVAALASLLTSYAWWRAAILAGAVLCLARIALAVCCVRGVPAARGDGLGRPFAESVAPPAAVMLCLGCAALLSLLAWWVGAEWWRGGLAVVLALVVTLLVLARTRRRFGGVTGDVFGACVELSFATMLIALV